MKILIDEETVKLALEAAYLAGFNASSDGYNGECGVGNPSQCTQWLTDRDNYVSQAIEQAQKQEPVKLWLWKNFVDGRPEYWAFDNPFPTFMDCADPQTLGVPCGYALFKPSRNGRPDRSESYVLNEIKNSREFTPQRQPLTDEQRVLRELMERENNTWGQGGALGYLGSGKWTFESKGITVTPIELNALYKLAGVEPKQIVSKGNCSDCAHSLNGRERGYERPCSNCCRPIMSNFKAAHGIKEQP